jgi:large subunit ribosomal protein L9
MKVILLQNIPKLGNKHDIKNVSDGYARNFLLPKKLVAIATPNALKNLQAEKQKERTLLEEKEELIKQSFAKLKDFTLTIKEKVNEKGQLFAGIDKARIAHELDKNGIKGIDINFIKLEKPIKKTGEYKVKIEEKEKSKAEIKIKVQS